MKNEHAVSFFIFNFQKKRMNRMQVRWLVLNNDHLFHSQTLTSFNLLAAPATLRHSAYWRQTDEIVCCDGNIQVPFNKGLFFVFLTCRFQKAWITDYVLRGFYKVKIWWRWRGVTSQFHSLWACVEVWSRLPRSHCELWFLKQCRYQG